MEISTYSEWEEEERQDQERLAPTYPVSVQYRIEAQRVLEHKREKLLRQFPFTAVATGEYPEHDYARRWCWRNISPENGRCDAWLSAYPACPFAIEERKEQVRLREKADKDFSGEQKWYTGPADHTHEGDWRFLWLGKTGYDYGYGEFCFRNERDLENFLVVFPTFIWSEDWDREER